MKIEFDKYSLIINGQRVFIKSAAMHYFRLIGEELWQDRLLKLKALGYNTVDLYICWSFHSDKFEQYNFDGIRNIKRLLEIAKDLGFYVIIRPGPYINAEISAGGYPLWFLKDKDVIPRNRIGNDFHYSLKYMEYVANYYDAIIPIINEFDNIICFQIENEYSTHTGEDDYMKELYEMVRSRGVKVPITHNDAFIAGLYADVVDIYACDIYPYINPNQDWKSDNFCFDTLDNLESIVRMSKEDAPIYIAELQAGWFDKWTGKGYKHIRDTLNTEHINIMTKTAISQGVTMFNHYMGVGGTSWGELACDEVYTSYDFTAGIDEYGLIQPNGCKAKEINYFLNSFDLSCTVMSDEDITLSQEENIYAKSRHDNINNCEWLFVRNFNNEDKKIPLKIGEAVHINSFDMKILPQNLKLKACNIDFSSYEIFAKLTGTKNETIILINDENAELKISDFNNQKFVHQDIVRDFESVFYKYNDVVTEFLFINRETLDKTWILDNKLIIRADYVYDNKIAVSKSKNVLFYDVDNGFYSKHFNIDTEDFYFKVENPDVEYAIPELNEDYDTTSWKVADEKLDALSNELYSEFLFYKAVISNKVKEIEISARHLFAVYINGKEVLNRDSYKFEQLQQISETISISLNSSILTKEKNQLTILVQNLGFDKGFSGDTNSPRGLVHFAVIPHEKVEFKVRDKFAFENNEFIESEQPYLAKIKSEFEYKKRDDVYQPLYISLANFYFSRATIFVNGVKIGRFLKDKQVQDKFYIPQSVLRDKNTLEIVVWEKDININQAWDFKFMLKNVIIKIGSIKTEQFF